MNDMTDFDPDAFVQSAIDGAMSTRVELIPKGDYRAVVEEIGKARKITPNDPTKNPFASVDIVFRIDAPEVASAIGRTNLLCRYNLLLDLDPATGRLDTRKGKNIRLGRLRELAGQNGPAEWVFGHLVGTGPFTVKVDHEEDRRDADLPVDERRVYDKVVSVGPA